MATYIVKPSQNIFDVAIMLHGSIEGLFDLLISNGWLNMTTDLKAGMKLEYHEFYKKNEGIVSEIEDQGYLAANGERHVYHKSSDLPLVFVFAIADSETERISFGVSAEGGSMLIDWGDNSDLQEMPLSTTVSRVEHWFDNKVDKRRVRVYGNFELNSFDAEGIPGTIFTMRPVTVDKFSCHENKYPLDGLFLFEGTYSVDLRYAKVKDLTPIGDMSLQKLDLRRASISSEVIDSYLTYIVANYGSRRNCKVRLTTEPSPVGMAAIRTIIGEESWNQSGHWVFEINGTIYTYTVRQRKSATNTWN